MISIDSNIPSPFKFLDSYEKNEKDRFFGRKQETSSLFDLYTDSSLVVLYGPSGSGKTSLIKCGLLNRIRVKEEAIYNIRRDDNFIQAINRQLLSNPNDITKNKPHLLDQFLKSQNQIKINKTEIKNLDKQIIKKEDEISVLQQKLQYEHQTISTVKKLPLDYRQIERKIIELENELTYNQKERNKSLHGLKSEIEKLNKVSSELRIYFEKKNKNLPCIPLIILDQFEELFIYGNRKEINDLGLFLKFLSDYNISYNIIISLREEYFGHLNQLQVYLPNIFYKTFRLSHPNDDKIKRIIEESFKEFNINQNKEPVSNNEVLHKKDPIELIIKQIKIQQDSEHRNHLPGLQIYLDRLYKESYQSNSNANTIDKHEKYPALSFSERNIEDIGSIVKVFEKYIGEIKVRIIKNSNNELNNRKEHDDTITKFLRHFKTKDDLKKRIPIIDKNGHIIIANQTLRHTIQMDIWGKANDNKYNETISEIIKNLNESNILKVSNGYAEFSHDIIAKVVTEIKTEKDVRILIKKKFISSFDMYEDTKDQGDLLSAQQINQMKQCLSFIMDDKNADRKKRKERFFTKSLEQSDKEEQNRKKQERMLNRFVYYPFVITCLLFILTALAYSFIRLEKENMINKLSFEIHEKMSHALRDYDVDRTASFNHILESEAMLKKKGERKKFWHKISNLIHTGSTSDFPINDSIFNIIKDFKNDLYNEYNKTPFYHNSISLGTDGIKSTKTRKVGSLLYIYALTESKKLILNWLEYKKKNVIPGKPQTIGEDIVAFEPFRNGNQQRVLIARIDANFLKLTLLDKQGKPQPINSNGDFTIMIEKKNLSKVDIEHARGLSFIIGVNNEIHHLRIDVDRQTNESRDINSLQGQIKKIKTFENPEHYLVLYGKNKLYIDHNLINSSTLNKKLNLDEHDEIHTFKIRKSDETIFLGLKGRIIELNLNPLKKRVHYVHDEQINTIATNNKGQILVGSRDNGANLLSKDNMLLKQFIGHTKPIHNVSFVKNDDNYIVTSGEDQTIKVWNISPIEDNLSHPDKNIQRMLDNSLIVYHEKDYLAKHINKEKPSINLDNIVDIDYSENGEYAVSGSTDNTAIIWKKIDSKYEILQELASHTGDIVDVDFSENNLVLTASKDRTVQIYKRENHNTEFIQIPSLIRHDYEVNSATFSPDGDYIFSCDNIKGNIKKWDYNKFDSIVNARTFKIDPNLYE